MRVCAFTGYRPYKFDFPDDDLNPRFQELQQVIRKKIIDLYYDGFEFFISGMSTGADMWCAEDVLWLQDKFPSLKLICAVPFVGQELKWPKAYQQEYRHILDYCYRKFIIKPVVDKSADINQYYLNRNKWMVDYSDVLLAVYSDDTATARSGTRATVNYARSQEHRIIYIHPSTFAVTET
jgi:uncharacterized phage-like protein YoqJ